MTLHEAIAKVLKQTNQTMSANDIVNELNRNKWYLKADRSPIKANQIIARAKHYPELLFIDRSFSPLHICLSNRREPSKSKITLTKIVSASPEIIITVETPTHLKTSFEPISNEATQMLILGSIPGDKSILKNEYYAHPRNKFWKIMATLTNTSLPTTYQKKIELLNSNFIGIWDVAYKANRIGSLDVAIKDEVPNEIDQFILKHKNLKVIGFNGIKSQVLYDKYFVRRKGIKYLLLPSTSPANTKTSFDAISKYWEQILYFAYRFITRKR